MAEIFFMAKMKWQNCNRPLFILLLLINNNFKHSTKLGKKFEIFNNIEISKL